MASPHFITSLQAAIRRGPLEWRLLRMEYVRGLADLLGNLELEDDATKLAAFRACIHRVHAWLVEDTLVLANTSALLTWATRWRVDLYAVETELQRLEEEALDEMADEIAEPFADAYDHRPVLV